MSSTVKMDPITAGVTIITLIQTIAQTSALVYGYISSVRNADSSCQTLLNQLNSILGVLTAVKEIQNDSSLPNNLRDVLSRLMAENGPITKLHEELKKLLRDKQENRKIGKISRLMWPFKEEKAATIVERLKSFYGDITTVLAIDSRITLKEVDRGVQELIQGSIAQRRRKFLQWMNPVSCIEKHNASCRQRNPNTGRWIFDTDQYVAWNKSDRAFLWLNGQAGHGKTILASSIINEVQNSGEAEQQTLAFFYCNFRDNQMTSAVAVVRSLVVQFLQQSEVDWVTKISKPGLQGDLVSLRNLWQQQHNAEPHPTDLESLRKLLVEVSTLVSRPVLVIDALDECKDYPDLVGHLVTLAKDAPLRLFVTSRSESHIHNAFNALPTISLTDEAGQMRDILVHISEQLENQTRLSCLPDELKNTILKKLLEKAEGMFRWVQCQLDEIVACKRLVDIKEALDNLPAGLYETYDRIIQTIKQRGRSDDKIAQNCLLWLAGAFTPLTLDQLNEAMMIEVGKSKLNPNLGVMDPLDIVAVCGSLVTYDEKTGVVALSHYSVKEYLINRPNNVFKSTSDMHARICELLITYVLCDFVDEVCVNCENSADAADVSEDHLLLSYAVQGWQHLKHVSEEDPCIMTALSRLNSEFRQNTKKHCVLATQDSFPGYLPSCDRWFGFAMTLPSLLCIPLQHGKPWMVEFIIKQHPDLLDEDVAPGWGSPLIFAMTKNPDCLNVLLKLGVDLNKLSSIKPEVFHCDGSYAPISWAAVIGSDVAVDFLLSQTEVNLPDDILHTAVLMLMQDLSHESIRKFRQRGADVNFTVDGSTPIHDFLSHNGTTELLPVLKALVEPSCNLSLQDWTARTVLHIALDKCLEDDVVIYLLEQGAGLSATATLHSDMWSWATSKTWFSKVQAAALAADQRHARIEGKVINAAWGSRIVEFSFAAIADRDNPNPICAVTVSAILDSELSSNGPLKVSANLSLQKKVQDSPKDGFPGLKFDFEWEQSGRRVSSRLFDYHQGDDVIRMLRQLTQHRDSTGTSFFLQVSEVGQSTAVFERVVKFTLDIYRGPSS
ncbi:uncharacterized protein BJ212DRAFT_1394146 [Suillus subaureus]|uniref:NACHT domain-containing protein n=1 Tax=Suillus subaureus TaxID=48587 RepID=A0A9P7DW40_9AGAM|nr:uncharacterized protein BJ212DRAFT_1394146 [Suillus subaureus]KAG1804443.1 hypothetical protein BJ212DRAFT_1394146 [Suillus subaureus]